MLVVGGGPAGLTMSALLGHHGVASVLIERRTGVNPHPRARSVNVRTAEIFRQLGLLQEIEAASLPEAWSRQMIYTESLAGREIGRTITHVQPVVDGRRVSPAPWLLSSQDQIEPVIRQRAEADDRCQVRFGVELTGLERIGDRWVARVATASDADGPGERIEARYVVAADGAGSTVRARLGIGLEGPTGLATLINCHFRADLDRWTTDRPAALYWTTHPARNVFQKIDTSHRWLCQIGYDPRVHRPTDFTTEVAASWIRTSIGSDDVDLEVIDVIPWTMSSTVAERFGADGVFLVGDAAHQLPPSGGFGMNTAVQDAHNLAWKLAFVLGGRASSELLDSYHTERAPIARYNADRSLDNTRNVGRIRRRVEEGGSTREQADAIAAAGRYGNWLGMDLGLRYEAGCLLADGSDPPTVEDPVSDYVDTGRPGHRAPHVELGGGRSTLDLYDRNVVAVLGDGFGAAERGRLRAGAPQTDVHRLDDGGVDGGQHRRHGIGRTGALLVRPDGHVAWRTRTGATIPDVIDALDRLGLAP